MRILVIGGGGREHALVWKLAQYHKPVFCAPGNAGIAKQAECVEKSPADIRGLADFARQKRIDLTIVGPEAPLVAGIADEFRKQGLVIFGPGAQAARLEGDKSFAKRLMQEEGIPTASFEIFDDYEKAASHLRTRKLPVVIKASGLAAGKGAIITKERDEAERVLREIMKEARFGPAGRVVVIEDFLTGEEASIIGLCDGEHIEMLLPSQDHKPLLDGDKGPNTGGMGAYAPAPVITSDLAHQIEKTVFQPLLAGLQKRNIDYRGVIYAGMMLTGDGPYVLEFNCRFGDPETQAVLPLLKNDLAMLAFACANGKLVDQHADWFRQSALCVIAASGGYPGAYKKGVVISGDLAGDDDSIVFHAGTRLEGKQIVTSGGRVLGVTGIGNDLQMAQEKAYQAMARIRFEGMFFRHDIGRRGLERLGLKPFFL